MSGFLNRTSGHKNGVAGGIAMREGYFDRRSIKNIKVRSFLRGFKNSFKIDRTLCFSSIQKSSITLLKYILLYEYKNILFSI